jgi:rhomboid-like protein
MSTRVRFSALASIWSRRLFSTARDSVSGASGGARLWRAFAFTALVGGTSYSISAIRGEENRKRWMRRYWAYRKEQGLAAEVKRWWLGLSAASRFSLTIIALNGAVFLMWRIRPLTFLMERYFISSTTQRSSLPLLLSSFSHMEWWHIGLNMMVLWSFAPALLSVVGDKLTAHRSWPFYLTGGMFASSVGLCVQRLRGLNVGSLGASGALLSVITLVVLNNPDAMFYLIFFPFIPLPAPIALMGVVAVDVWGLVRGWQLLDHAGHLGGVLFACLYHWGLGAAISRGQARLVRRWKKFQQNSRTKAS